MRKFLLALVPIAAATARADDLPPPISAVPVPAVAAPAPVQVTSTLPGTVVPTRWSQDVPRTMPPVDAPKPIMLERPTPLMAMPVAPTVGPISIDCNGRTTGCPSGPRGSLLGGSVFGRFLTGSACETECPQPSRRPRVLESLDVRANRGCDAGHCATDRGCWQKFTSWLCWHPCYTQTLPVFRPTPYHAPLTAYFPDCKEPCGANCAGGKCGPTSRINLNRGGRLNSIRNFFDPNGFGSGDCAGGTSGANGDTGCCGCKPMALRYANPCCVPPGNPLTASPVTQEKVQATPGGVVPSAYQKPATGTPVTRPFTNP